MKIKGVIIGGMLLLAFCHLWIGCSKEEESGQIIKGTDPGQGGGGDGPGYWPAKRDTLPY